MQFHFLQQPVSSGSPVIRLKMGLGLIWKTIVASWQVFAAVGIAVSADAVTCASEVETRPNIVILLADDLGYGDVNLELPGLKEFANPHIKTPHLASLAEESLVFRHHYAAAPVCSPSRAGLLTGRTPTRCNIDLYINDRRDNDRRFLAGEEITVAEIAKQAGYQTVVFGKWHLNGADWETAENWNGWISRIHSARPARPGRVQSATHPAALCAFMFQGGLWQKW